MKNILVPTDFSDCSINALNYAGLLSEPTNSNIHFLHVYQVPNPATDVPVIKIIPTKEMEKRFRKKMEEIVTEQRLKQGWTTDVSILVSNGISYFEINNTVDEKKIDLIVMGMRGQATIIDKVFGSTATEMIKKATCPLLLIPEEATFNLPDRIAVAIDFKHPEDIQKLQTSGKFVKIFNSRLDIFSIIHEDEVSPSDKAVVFAEIENALKDTEHHIHFQSHQEITEGILNFMAELQCKILVIFHHSHNIFARIFSSIYSKDVSFNIKVPMLVINSKV